MTQTLKIHEELPVESVAKDATPVGVLGARLIPQAELFRDRLNVSKPTGHRMASAGKIGPRPIRVGGLVKYLAEEVDAWLRNPRPDGSLHDAKAWSAVWAALKAKR